MLVWNALVEGDSEDVAILVDLNSIFQIAPYAFYVYFLIMNLSDLVSPGSDVPVEISIVSVAIGVLIYLGIPFFAGIITRYTLRSKMGAD
jgi:ACR3 family arsenite transporter